ncbi:MAG: type 11 methyltransferase [Gammaproteobacteria bacterium]|nr:MAG: type 11 methyltransferase [Gammaproteobacteria bacterium]TND04504.1 MAG: type 11 methyltransferase [Gammaproteobacteria bacterium]
MQTTSQLREHYEIERQLADRLRSASKDERKTLYTSLYDELFKRVPHHPQLSKRTEKTTKATQRQARFLGKLCKQRKPVFLEVGPGDCAISLEMAKYDAQVYAVDVSNEITNHIAPPRNFSLILSDGCSVDVPKESVDLAFSNQLMEHLHPDDAIAQLHNIYSALKPGGKYFIVTPSRFSGPHDVSQHFDDVATGFHLHEYSLDELMEECRNVGFSKFTTYIGKDGSYLSVPIWVVRFTEKIAGHLPKKWRKFSPLRLLLGIRLMAERGML